MTEKKSMFTRVQTRVHARISHHLSDIYSGDMPFTAWESGGWATPQDIKSCHVVSCLASHSGELDGKARLKNPHSHVETRGVPLAFNEVSHPYYSKDHAHILAVTPPPHKESLVVHALQSWTQSVVVTDVDRTLFTHTAKGRQDYGHVLFFDPLHSHSVRFNPMDEI